MSGPVCPSCSATVAEKNSASPATCHRCGKTFHFDEVGTYEPLVATCTVSEKEATGRIMEWASGVKGGREFSRNIELARMTRRFYPVFVFSRLNTGEEQQLTASAVGAAEPGIRNIDFSDAELHGISGIETADSECIKPNLSPSAYGRLLSVDPASRNVVYYPFWCTQYVYHGKLNTVTVDGCTGRVSGDLSVEIERKSSMPYAAAAFAAIGLEGALAYFSWIVAAAAVALTAAFAVYRAAGKKEE